tara:strand:+ start:169 stop:747 length:579 start_codon:yes stop_codon:yes gene_type:complete
MAKLKKLLSEIFEEAPKIDKHRVIEGVSKYSAVGKALYGENNLVKIAEQLVEIAESAHSHIIGEQGDWFDKVTVNKNMKALKTQVKEFKVVANEANAVNQRLTSLYEDMGHILNRYYDINEGDLDPVGKEDGDIDNDGDKDSSDEYLAKKRAAISKAMKETAEIVNNRPKKSLKDVTRNVSATNSIGYFKKK